MRKEKTLEEKLIRFAKLAIEAKKKHGATSQSRSKRNK
ncbi:hypothetical protein J2T17_004398 [Paenibacillus mucilaginosus]